MALKSYAKPNSTQPNSVQPTQGEQAQGPEMGESTLIANLPAIIPPKPQPAAVPPTSSIDEFTITVDELFEPRAPRQHVVPFSHHQPPVQINPETHLEELELYPRHTLIRMLQEKAYDENFTFKCKPRKGPDYVQAMRQHLSRGRRVAERRHLELQEFKLLVVGIETFTFYDLVTLVRTTQASRSAKTVYDDLIGFVAAEVKHGTEEG